MLLIKIRTQMEAMLSGNHSIDVSTVITDLATLTKPGNEPKLNTNELSDSVDVLAQLMTYNSLKNNSAIITAANQRNILKAASNLLEKENTRIWLLLQKVNSAKDLGRGFIVLRV